MAAKGEGGLKIHDFCRTLRTAGPQTEKRNLVTGDFTDRPAGENRVSADFQRSPAVISTSGFVLFNKFKQAVYKMNCWRRLFLL